MSAFSKITPVQDCTGVFCGALSLQRAKTVSTLCAGIGVWMAISLVSLPIYAQVPPPDNFGQSLSWQLRAAEAGNPQAQYVLGLTLEQGLKGEANKVEAAEWYAKAAAKGHTLAQMRLARMLYTGDGVARDVMGAARLYSEAASSGNAQAQYNYASLLESGSGVEKNLVLAATLYESAARQGVAPAQVGLAMLYARGAGVGLNIERAVTWLEVALGQGALVPKTVYEALNKSLSDQQRKSVKTEAQRIQEQIANR